ncbi:hypothetical protein [Amedibacillus sp. YH-ame10]
MYKLSKGIKFSEAMKIIDQRLMIEYDDVILRIILNDALNGKIINLNTYLEKLNIPKHSKKNVKNCINFCIKRGLIYKSSLLFNSLIWDKSRLKMNVMYFFQLLLFLPLVFPFLAINMYLKDNLLNLVIQFYIIHLLAIYLHETFHSFFYWIFQKKTNGYYKYDYLNCSFVYNECELSPYMRFLVAVSGTIFTCLALCFFYYFPTIFRIVLLIEIIIQFVSFVIGTDLLIMIDALKGRKLNSQKNHGI